MKLQLTACLILLGITASAQKSDTIRLDPSGFESEERFALPFGSVKVIDARFDRGNIGCMHQKVKTNRFTYARVPAVFPDSFHLFLPKLIGNIVSYSPDSHDTLVILFKQFRIVEHFLNGLNQKFEPQLLVKVSASFFHQKNDSLFRIFSFDDLISTRWPLDRQLKKDVVLENRNEVFMKSLQVLFQRKSWQSAGLGFAASSVDDGIQKRFQLPMFTDGILRAGVYRTFKEFKNNSPSIQNVKIRMSKSVPIDVVDAEGKQMDIKNYWGVCTENKRFIFFRGRFYELFPSDRSFRFHSYSQTNDLFGQPSFGDYAPQAGILAALLIKASDNDVSRQSFYLNMDEEDIYLEEIFGKSGLKVIQKELLK
ncbi:MAG TPA: hypothetical protein VGB71_14380 [Flavisolibacter sp.]